ncbi:unnamed protein product [Amoebophrya sp. A120]|nr:unnamed protein product [Amoebophrya sp. A120]|eukprot:GSA120T00018982001.1
MVCLEFHSHWVTSKGENKETLRILFDVLTAEAHVSIGADKHLTTVLYTTTPPARLAGVWDLFPGAEVRLLGRKIQLRQCSSATSRWVDYWGKKLTEIIFKLEQAIKESDPIAAKSLDEGSSTRGGSPTASSTSRKNCHGTNLWHMLTRLHRLHLLLARTEPQLASTLRVPPEMIEIENLAKAMQEEDGEG